MRKYSLNVKEVEGKKFYYVDFGSEVHGRKSFRLWVNRKLVQRDEDEEEFIEFPIKAEIVKTEKGTIVLRPSNKYTFDLFVKAGYRGNSRIELLSETDVTLEYYIYHSPRGSLGVSMGMLVTTSKEGIKYRWERSGRTYGAPKQGITFMDINGKETTIEHIADGIDELKRLDELLE